MTPAEYQELDSPNDTISSQFQLTPSIDITDKKIDAETAIDPTLIICLTLINDKLDLILELLDKDNNINGFQNGFGANISGAGINIVVDSPLGSGQINYTKFYLLRIPLVYMEIFGEVVHSTKVNEYGKTH